MTDSGSSPGSPQNGSGIKSLITKGVIGAVSLAGTTAIPLLVQKHLNSSAPASSPSPAPAAQVSPAPTASASPAPELVPAQVQPANSDANALQMQNPGDDGHGKKGKKKGKPKD